MATVKQLRDAGYSVARAGEGDASSRGIWGDSEIIYVDPTSGVLTAGHDHRHGFGSAAGY